MNTIFKEHLDQVMAEGTPSRDWFNYHYASSGCFAREVNRYVLHGGSCPTEAILGVVTALTDRLRRYNWVGRRSTRRRIRASGVYDV